MATIKINWLRAGLILIVLLFGVFVVVNAMGKSESVIKAVTPMTVYFIAQSNDPSALQNTTNWNAEPNGLECDGFTYLCEVTFDTNTYPDLNAFLTASPDRSAIESNALAVSHKD